MLSCGIVGLPNVGKSTLFNALLKKQQALVANYPFVTIEPNVGVVPVPDERLERLADLVAREENDHKEDPSTEFTLSDVEVLRTNHPPIVPAVIRFVDIAGLVKGASQGEGLGNQFLSHIREVDAIVQVVRVFEDENVIRSGSTDPQGDIEVVNTELILADLKTVQNSKLSAKGGLVSSKLSGEAGSLRSNQKNQNQRRVVLEKLESGLNEGKLTSELGLNADERLAMRDLQLLTDKPFLYVFNVGEKQLTETDRVKPFQGLTLLGSNPIKPLIICAKIEAELEALSETDQAEYLKQLGIKERGLDQIIRAGYSILGLISFLTAGPKEVRAWTIKRGSKAPQAAGTIHSDFERGFVAAEVAGFDELLAAGSWQGAKELGKIRQEGKDYVMQDGDVVEFRFSV